MNEACLRQICFLSLVVPMLYNHICIYDMKGTATLSKGTKRAEVERNEEEKGKGM